MIRKESTDPAFYQVRVCLLDTVDRNMNQKHVFLKKQ